MRQMQIADLTASANEIDTRMGPIPGRSSDRIANELRWAAAELDRLLKEREVAAGGALVEALRAFAVHATYPVSTEINPRGYAWRGEGALDHAKGLADAALADQPTAAPVNGWIHLKAKRVLSVDRGKTTILCDRDIPTELMILLGSAPSEENCPGHVAWSINPKICAKCGVHIDSLRPPEDEQ